MDESREKKTEEKERSVDWKLIVEISLLLFFFSLVLTKATKERGDAGGRCEGQNTNA